MKQQQIQHVFEHLHNHAEVSWKEIETTNYLVELFEASGFSPQRFKNCPGFYVEIGSGHPVVGLRADMDALWQEVDGEMKANHSCGHDAHMTIVTGVMHELKDRVLPHTGTVRAIFQPAEELGNGSLSVVAEGVADDLDYLYGVHLRPHDEISFPQCAPGIQHGACVFAKGWIKGHDAHGARPHQGVNAIEVLFAIQQHINTIHVDPHIAATIKFTNIQAGTDNLNIIPGNATFGLDIRAQTNEAMAKIQHDTQKIIATMRQLYACDIEFTFLDDVPAAEVDADASALLATSIQHVLQQEALPVIVTPGADDFHFYTIERPQIKATMLALGADVAPGLHHPNMTFNPQAIENGIAILTDVVCRTLAYK
ncbi:amidohydrolase [Lysinibacillus alkalisoli]|uniref:Amidohydrolase n=1 Tax=Lysinibacillus alkalisoli TaxID=1911548 RepID=A0A917G8D6_9BACI|nr:amidohydrolase [Lysinibacillus alkalisoli]GGG27951.1 amidohydrolase [Lysinibacillus alkalisoli]